MDPADITLLGLLAALYAAPLSYIIGLGPAAAAGFAIGLRRAIRDTASLNFTLAVRAGAGILFTVGTGQSLLLFSEATMACWLFVSSCFAHPVVRALAQA